MGVYKNLENGQTEIVVTREELRGYLDKFRESPEVKKMFAEIEAERKIFVRRVLEEAQRAKMQVERGQWMRKLVSFRELADLRGGKIEFANMTMDEEEKMYLRRCIEQAKQYEVQAKVSAEKVRVR